MSEYTAYGLQLNSTLETLRAQPLAVVSHVRPDGDCIGSTIALVRTLAARGFDVVGLNADPLPRNLTAFIGDTRFTEKATASALAGRTVITVDCADFRRIGRELAEAAGSVALNIDHHISNQGYAADNLIVGHASATAEILAGLFLGLGWEIDPVAAQALYLGIATDTGQFRFPSTTELTFDFTRRLCALGANPAAAARELYENERFSRIRLLQGFLASLRLECNGAVCLGVLSESLFRSSGAKSEEAEGFVDYARSIEGVAIGILIEEQKAGRIKASLRSKDSRYRVDKIAALYRGGGHACAAGLNVEGMSADAFADDLLENITTHLQHLDQEDA